MRKILIAVLGAILLTSGVFAGQLLVTKSKDVTSKDIPLKFTLEKTTWDGDDVKLWGTVKNTGNVKYTSVRVIFTARDAKGKFIGRNSWYIDPTDIGPGQVGYIEDKFVQCEGRRPTSVEFSVIGEK